MIYVDTSVLVALHTRERYTTAVLAWYADLGDTPIATAAWAMTEFASALAIKQRTYQLNATQANRAWRQFERQCTSDLRLLPVDHDAFEDAARMALAPSSGLRSGDALHLAVARRANAAAVSTLDATMQKNARRLRMQVVPLATT